MTLATTPMPARFTSYPLSLREAVRSIYDNPLNGSQKINKMSKKINAIGEPASRLYASDFNLKESYFFSAICGPCLVLAKAVKGENDQLEEAAFAHLSTRFEDDEIDAFLGTDSTKADSTMLWMAGMAQKSSIDTLNESAAKLVKIVQNFGINLHIHGKNTEAPSIHDMRGGERIISDIGLGVGDSNPSRRVIFGVSRSHCIFVSNALSFDSTTTGHIHTCIFSGDGDSDILL